MAEKPDSINKVLKTAASKVTGEYVEGAYAPRRRYAISKSVNLTQSFASTRQGIRTAQSLNTNITSPNFYTPFTTPSAFQIPNNRKEVYLWSQWWYDNEPVVAAAIEFYTDFPLSEFELECPNGYVKDYFEELVKKLNFSKWLPMISQEYHLRGDVFIMATIDCQHCHGTNFTEDGEECKHDGATWKSLTVLNPDTMESTGYFLDEEPKYYMMPTDDMVKIVQEKTPKDLYERVPEQIRQKILQRQPIFLDPISIYHMKRGAAPWQPYGTSMVRRLFPTLAYKDKLRQAQWLVAERHIIPIKIVKIGSDDRPASDEDIEAVQTELTNVANDPLLTLVTHHNFNFDYYGANGKVLTLTNEYELINQDLIDGFMLNKAIINGEGPSYSNAQVGLLTMAKRLERFREEVAYWIEEKVFKPVAEWNGFTIDGKRGQEEVIYPTIKWADLELRDNSNKLQIMQAAQQAGILSAQTFLEALGVEYDQEVERLRFENTAGFISTPDANLGAMGGGYGGAAGGGGGGLGDLLGGMGGGGGGAPGEPGAEPGAPPMGGAPGEPPGGAGGAPPTAPMASSRGSADLYRQASTIVNDIYNAAIEPVQNNINKRVADNTIKGERHEEFLKTLPLVTGRGRLGVLPTDIPDFVDAEIVYPSDGGSNCYPLNIYAIEQYGLVKFAKKQKDEGKQINLFSTLERKLYELVLSANIPYAFYAQYQAGPGLQYQIDGAFPGLKLGLEADSRTFHNSPEKVASDRQRDITLASQGWTMLRFTEEELQEQSQQVINVVLAAVRQLAGGGSAKNNQQPMADRI